MRITLSIFFALAATAPALASNRVGLWFTCTATLVTMHQDSDKRPSFQVKPEGNESTFVVKVAKTQEPDILHCDKQEKPTAYTAGYCKFPYQAVIESKNGEQTLYSDDGDNFRGFFPWKYFAFFADGHFLWSSTVSDGVVIQTGACRLK